MSTKFFTNKDNNTLLNKLKGVFENLPINYFDALVGYFRSSGYFKIREYLKDVEEIRILVGIDVDHLISDAITGLQSETKEILETYRIFSRDKGWFRRISEAIEQGLTAEAAVDHVRTEIVHKMQSIFVYQSIWHNL